jgi:hypothetical protein
MAVNMRPFWPKRKKIRPRRRARLNAVPNLRFKESGQSGRKPMIDNEFRTPEVWSARTCPRFESGDMSPQSKTWRTFGGESCSRSFVECGTPVPLCLVFGQFRYALRKCA